MKRTRLIGAALASVALLLGTAACGAASSIAAKVKSDPGDSTSEQGDGVGTRDALAKVKRATKKAGSADVVIVMGQPKAKVRVQMEGSMSWADGASMDVLMSGSPGLSELSGKDEMHCIFKDEVYYYELGEKGRDRFQGRKWLSVARKAVPHSTGGVDGQTNADPAVLVGFLQATKDVKAARVQRVAGVETTRYSGTGDVEEMLEANPELDTAAEAEAARKQMEQIGATSFTVKMWIGDDDLPVAFRQEIKTAQGTVFIDQKYKNFAGQPKIQAPPKSEVLDISESMSKKG